MLQVCSSLSQKLVYLSKMFHLIVNFFFLQLPALVCILESEGCLQRRRTSVHKDGDVVIGGFSSLYFYVYYTGIIDITPGQGFYVTL